jgi:hypothetical protein
MVAYTFQSLNWNGKLIASNEIRENEATGKTPAIDLI